MLAFGVLFLFIALVLALFGFGAVGSWAGDWGKVSAGISLAVAVVCSATGGVFWRRAVARDETARRWAAWTH